MRAHRRRPGAAAAGEPAAPGAGGGAVSAGRWSCSGWADGDGAARTPTRNPTPGRLPQAPHLRLERNVVRLRRVAGQLPDEHRGGADERRLAAEEPAPRLPVVAQRRLVQLLAAGVRDSAPSGVESQQVVVVEAAVFERVERSSARSWPGGEIIHPDRAGGQQPLAVLDQRGCEPCAWARPGRPRRASARTSSGEAAHRRYRCRSPSPPTASMPSSSGSGPSSTGRQRSCSRQASRPVGSERPDRPVGAAQQDQAVDARSPAR